jgi:hypothetical protein
VRDDRPLIRTRDDLLELIAHVLRLQLSYLSKDQSVAVADTILRTSRLHAYRSGSTDNAGARGSGVMESVYPLGPLPMFSHAPTAAYSARARVVGFAACRPAELPDESPVHPASSARRVRQRIGHA